MITLNVKKTYSDFTLDLSMSFSREVVAVAGPNGSGKTTLLRLIAGLERPEAGRMVVSGQTFFDETTFLKPEERKVGYVFQNPALFPWLTVEKNILFGVKDAPAEWLRELYAEADIADLLQCAPKSLSGGQAQRVALVRALAARPDMLLLDEPFSAVDMELRPRLRNFVSRLQREWKIPLLLVTHDPGEVHTMADRLFELSRGSVVDSTAKGELSKRTVFSY